MPKGNSLRKAGVAENREDEDGPRAAAQPYWEDGAEGEEAALDGSARRDSGNESKSELYRAGKIDAYLNYLKMRPQTRDGESVTLRRSAPVRDQPRYRSFEEDDEERDVRLHGYQQRSIRRPSPRAPRLPTREPRRKAGRDIALAASLSLAVAGLTGLIVFDRTSGGSLSQAVTNKVAGLWASAPVAAALAEEKLADADAQPAMAASPSLISKKPVAIAGLQVEDAAGEASSSIPLSLKADPAIPGQALALKLSGMPESASLTAGTRVSETEWMLRPGEEQGVKFVAPASLSGQFSISVEALEPRTGDLAAPVKEMTVSVSPAVAAATIEPAAAPAAIVRNFNLPAVKPEPADLKVAEPVTSAPEPPAPALKPAEPQFAAVLPPAKPLKPDSAMPIPSPIEKTSVVQSGASPEYIRSGDKLMGLGELAAARQFYARALERGVSEAALKLGETYDPAIFADKNVQGMKPDPAMAMKYYLQAQASGVAEARQSIEHLEAWMQR